jgi:hypothetical protein
LDTLLGYDTDYPFMISLNGNPEYFLTKIIEWKKNKIYEIEKMLAKEKNDLIVFNKHYEEYLSDRIEKGYYNTLGHINFTYNNESISGTTDKTDIYAIKIENIISVEELKRLINTSDAPNIRNIFIDSKSTNLALITDTESLKNIPSYLCAISLDKLETMSRKAKVEIDIER